MPSMVAHICNRSTQQTETRGPMGQVSLDCIASSIVDTSPEKTRAGGWQDGTHPEDLSLGWIHKVAETPESCLLIYTRTHARTHTRTHVLTF